VFTAAAQSVGGEIFVREASSTYILDIAEEMISRLAPGGEVEIHRIGVRLGERIHETLVSEEEPWRTLETEDGFII
jgi:FlaA1/EpsC-like NDP-sugar epimerase